MLELLLNPGYVTFFLLVPTQNFQNLENSACCCDPKADEACGGLKKLFTNIFVLCFLQYLYVGYLRLY